eukprot:513713_1
MKASNERGMCPKGHTLNYDNKNLENHKCIQCGARNPGHNKNHKTPNEQQIQEFLNAYDITQIPFGPTQQQRKYYKVWERKELHTKYPLHFAAYTGNVNEIKKLCEMKDIEEQRTDDNNRRPLHYAAWYNQLPA